MQVTYQQLTELFPSTSSNIIDNLLDDLNYAMEQFFIDSTERIAMFLAQVGVESGGLRHREENLNYSAERLMQVFPRHFRGVDVNQYARNPEKIANRVYGNRMGNGPESSGDGWRYRGRGLIQLTGKNNYLAFADAMAMSLDEVTEYMQTEEGACMSAAWFWETNGLNPVADTGNVDEASRIINAGPRGLLSSVHALPERRNLYRRALSILS